jgi:hypothetical protein
LTLSLLSVTAVIGSNGCVPKPIIRLEPTTANPVWIGGRASIEQEQAGVRVAVAFEHQDGDNLAVRVEVENDAGAPIEVSPSDFSYVTCTTAAPATCGPARRVIDPEGVLTALDTEQSYAEAEAGYGRASLTPLVLLGPGGSIREGHHSGVATPGMLGAESGALHGRRQAAIDVQRQLWGNEAFRRNTLPQGAGAAGYVLFPLEPTSRYVWLTIRAGGRVFPFSFRQTLTPVEVAASSTTTID